MPSPLIGASGVVSTTLTSWNRIVQSTQTVVWQTTSEVTSAVVMPGNITVSSLSVILTTAPGVGNSYIFTIMKNGVATGVTCTIVDTNLSAQSVGAVTYSASDTISIQCVPVGTPASSGNVYWTAVTEDSFQPLIQIAGTASTVTTLFSCLMGRSAGATELVHATPMPCAGVLSNLYASLIGTAPGVGTSKTLVLRKNGVSTALTTTIADTATSNTDLVNSVSVAAGDLVCIQTSSTGVPTSSAAIHSILFTPTKLTDSILLMSVNAVPSNTVTTYNCPVGTSPGAGWQTTEPPTQMLIGSSWTVKNFYARIGFASGVGTSWDISVRKNAATTPLTMNFANTTLVQSITNNVILSQSDLVNIRLIPNATPNAGSVSFVTGMLLNRTDPNNTYIPYTPPFLA